MNKHIIDVTDERFKNFPITLDGEIFLEKTLDSDGKVSGYLTISVDKIMSFKTKTDTELEQMGWMKYKQILDSF